MAEKVKLAIVGCGGMAGAHAGNLKNMPEAEVVGLFLGQLPATLALIEAAETAADWKLATHTLKGSAASIGARRLSGS